MTMTIDATHWYSWDFDVTDDARHVAHLDLSAWRERGVLTIDGAAHRVYREGVGGGDFLLERDGIVMARATKPSAFRSAFEVRHDGRTYELAKESFWQRRFVLRSGNAEIGSIAPRRTFGREAVATLPEPWPLPLKVFVIWLVVLMWKRAAANAS
jgi:hypothetical protein